MTGSLLFLVTSVAWGAPRTLTLDVPGMTCPTCPVTIKKALLKQSGVTGVTVRYEKKQLDVAFDDAKTDPTAIMKSTASVGFPSQPAK
ncbi:MAG: mercuric transport protein periplasmic component [Acidobacteriales bacterium 59-55]|nr:MAG: mercuric transport protein periplasmic component [Acidobacteriales bacterium 59-55]